MMQNVVSHGKRDHAVTIIITIIIMLLLSSSYEDQVQRHQPSSEME